MDNITVLDGLGEPASLSPLSANVHDEDFSGLGDHTENGIVETHLHSDGEEALVHDEGEDVDDGVSNTIVSSAISADDDDPMGLVVSGATAESLHHVPGLQVVHDAHVSEALGEGDAQNVLDEHGVLTSEGHLVQAFKQEGILLATDSDGNMAMPVSPDQVIRFLMQTSDGSVVATDAQVDGIKFSMSGLMSAEAGEVTQTIQAITLPDGTTTFFQTPKDNSVTESQVLPKLIEGQTIKLEDGTTALLQPRETLHEGGALQAIQLEDGTTAFISHPNTEGLFEAAQLQAAGLHIDQLASQTMMGVIDKPAEKALVIGDKAYKCAYQDCGRLYTTLHHLRVHERSHTGDRPFTCEYPGCGKAFATGYGLKSHNRVHTGEKPYPCPEMGCEKAFKTSGDLQKHVRTHTGERPFKCPFEGCTRSFTTSNIRKVHIRTHTGERPYVCDVEGCGRAFASATNYKNHIRIHTGEKPYVCTVQGCGKAFTEYSSLYKHHVVHTHTKPYTCCYCGKTYRQTSTLAMHKRSTHGEDLPTEGASENAFTVTTTPMSDISGEPPSKKAKVKAELEEETPENQLATSSANVSQMVLLTSQVNNNAVATASTVDNDASQLASLVTLQSSGTISLQDLQQNGIQGITSLALGEGGQQVLVVTDPAQLEALQQLAAQQLENLSQTGDAVVQSVALANPE